MAIYFMGIPAEAVYALKDMDEGEIPNDMNVISLMLTHGLVSTDKRITERGQSMLDAYERYIVAAENGSTQLLYQGTVKHE
jgi:hypothetical protein